MENFANGTIKGKTQLLVTSFVSFPRILAGARHLELGSIVSTT